jgi:hypothetical protein
LATGLVIQVKKENCNLAGVCLVIYSEQALTLNGELCIKTLLFRRIFSKTSKKKKKAKKAKKKLNIKSHFGEM